jgi:phage protein U
MSLPLALIGSAVLETIGFNPQGFEYAGEAIWATHLVFDEEPFHQSTAGGEETETVYLACRPHVFGGLQNYEALKSDMRKREAVPFIRLTRGFRGSYQGLVGVRSLSKAERKIAPGGMGYRWEFTAELLYVGRQAGSVAW